MEVHHFSQPETSTLMARAESRPSIRRGVPASTAAYICYQFLLFQYSFVLQSFWIPCPLQFSGCDNYSKHSPFHRLCILLALSKTPISCVTEVSSQEMPLTTSMLIPSTSNKYVACALVRLRGCLPMKLRNQLYQKRTCALFCFALQNRLQPSSSAVISCQSRPFCTKPNGSCWLGHLLTSRCCPKQSSRDAGVFVILWKGLLHV